ncbi:cell surface glycoprotein CD200 receptor 1-B-like [Ammospiza caudacuta]|uniref:cell surface glycoprotein CD200 receptor 1-B-like n=1 Tax=Ammospiza caudacuta TaxID=2857398 RepID=UPI0027387E86|nr:cell surface glycoprotein CD200 receptor 1-B-like [Ammospiza caudacuta]
MLGSSQQAGQCKKVFSSTKARATLKVVRKSICTIVLLTIAAVTGTTGHNSSALVMTVGNSSVLNCSFKGNITLLKWTITPKAGGLCTLVYRADKKKTHRTTCSDNINLIFRADLPPALEIWQVGLAQEGNYSCDVASAEGNFHKRYHLTVQAPPRLSLSCDEQGSPVCEAAAGKPPAQLSWAPEGSSTAEERCHDNGTVTVLSKFTACSTSVTSVITCMVSHPAGNWNQSIACCPSGKTGFFLLCVISLIGLLSLLFLLAAFELDIFSNRTMSNWCKSRQFPPAEVSGLEQR